MKYRSQSALIHEHILQRLPGLDLPDYRYSPEFHPFSLDLSSQIERIRSIALAFLIVGLLAICSTLSFELWESNPTITRTSALLELLQIFCLAIATLVQGLRAHAIPVAGVARFIRTSLALFTLTIFLLEIDMNKLGLTANQIVTENALRAAALGLILLYLLRKLRKLNLVARDYALALRSPTLLISILASVFYVAAWQLDKGLPGIDSSLLIWIEETLELNACLLFVCASLANNIRVETTNTHSPSI